MLPTNLTLLQWSSAAGLLSVGISLVALAISAFTLWTSHLSPFGLEVTYSDPTFCLYKVKLPDAKKAWWIPSFDVAVSFYNKGQRTGRIFDLRIVADIKRGKISKTEIFSAMFVVRHSPFFRDHHERPKWLDSSVERHWYPLILPPKRTTHIHVVLEGPRWDTKGEGSMDYRFEILASSSMEWNTVAKYRQVIAARMYRVSETWTRRSMET